MELRLHDSYARGWGVDLGSVVVHPATHAYTDFLMEVAEDPEVGRQLGGVGGGARDGVGRAEGG